MVTLSRPSYRLQWEAQDVDTLAYYETAVREPARANTNEAEPGSRAWRALHDAIDVRFCFPRKRSLATEYLRKGKEVAELALQQDLFRAGRASELFPLNRAEVLRAKILIDGLLRGAQPEPALCGQAAKDHLHYASIPAPHLWDANEQGHYEDGLELLLMAGLLDEAAEMIRSARSMRGKGVKERFTGSKAIVKAGTCPITDPKVRDAYMAMFDAVRDPQFDTRGGCPLTVVEKFSLGVLWDKYFVSTDGTIDWDRALEATRA
jgi:hypothetical protein